MCKLQELKKSDSECDADQPYANHPRLIRFREEPIAESILLKREELEYKKIMKIEIDYSSKLETHFDTYVEMLDGSYEDCCQLQRAFFLPLKDRQNLQDSTLQPRNFLESRLFNRTTDEALLGSMTLHANEHIAAEKNFSNGIYDLIKGSRKGADSFSPN